MRTQARQRGGVNTKWQRSASPCTLPVRPQAPPPPPPPPVFPPPHLRVAAVLPRGRVVLVDEPRAHALVKVAAPGHEVAAEHAVLLQGGQRAPRRGLAAVVVGKRDGSRQRGAPGVVSRCVRGGRCGGCGCCGCCG
jgi:hypothetical protein